MPILDYKADTFGAPLAGAKPLPPLAAVAIAPSRWLQRLLRATYIALALLTGWLLLPYAKAHVAWWLLLLLVALVLWFSYRARLQLTLFNGNLSYQSPWWILRYGYGQPAASYQEQTRRFPSELKALVWPWVIILYWPPQPSAGGLSKEKGFTLVLLRDSLSDADFRQLKRWLLACLKPGDL